MCEHFLQNTEFQEKLREVDIIVYDSVAGCPAVMLGERYDIPRVEILPLPLTSAFSFSHMVPMPVSYVPQLFTGFTDKMSFLERVAEFGSVLCRVAIGTYCIWQTNECSQSQVQH